MLEDHKPHGTHAKSHKPALLASPSASTRAHTSRRSQTSRLNALGQIHKKRKGNKTSATNYFLHHSRCCRNTLFPSSQQGQHGRVHTATTPTLWRLSRLSFLPKPLETDLTVPPSSMKRLISATRSAITGRSLLSSISRSNNSNSDTKGTDRSRLTGREHCPHVTLFHPNPVCQQIRAAPAAAGEHRPRRKKSISNYFSSCSCSQNNFSCVFTAHR